MELLLVALMGIPETDPPLPDRDRFPPRQAAAEALRFNRAYRKHVEVWRWTYLHQREKWGVVLRETEYLYHCWDWLHAAQGGEGRDETYWRYSLKRLRDLLGETNYQEGRMPPPVPVWRFQSAD